MNVQWQQVTCMDCRRTYQCTPDDDYFAPGQATAPASTTSGVCFKCLLARDGLDIETTGVLVLDVDLNEIDPRDGSG